MEIKDFLDIVFQKKKLELSKDNWKKIEDCYNYLEELIQSKKTIYGINTGFGALGSEKVPIENLEELQKNLIYHLVTGVGDKFSKIESRGILLARIHCLSLGHSAVSSETLGEMMRLLEIDLIPVIPEQGTVGASGDLTPLAHLALAMMGEGEFYFEDRIVNSEEIQKQKNYKPIKWKGRDALAIVNGTSAMTAIACLNSFYANRIFEISLLHSFLYSEILEAKTSAFSKEFFEVRQHNGFEKVINKFINWIQDSNRFQRENEVLDQKNIQDPYTIRCIPQIYGSIYDIISYHDTIVKTELNSVTDNPIFFPEKKSLVHGGNFYGSPIAFVSDTLKNGLISIASHIERKIARLTDKDLNRGLPAFLSSGRIGLDSGFMGLQVSASSLLAELRGLAIPMSIQTIPTNANNQDIVPMGTIAARKTRDVAEIIFSLLGMEAIVLAQGIELSNMNKGYSKLALEFLGRIRKISKKMNEDRPIYKEIETIAEQYKKYSFEI